MGAGQQAQASVCTTPRMVIRQAFAYPHRCPFGSHVNCGKWLKGLKDEKIERTKQ